MSEATSGINQVPSQFQKKESIWSRIFGNKTDTSILEMEREAFTNARAVATDTGEPQRIKVGGDEYEISDPKKAGIQVKPL